jgi:hypothetical protein
MKNRSLFSNKANNGIESKIKMFLNEQEEFLSGSTVRSTRAAGDAIQHIITEQFPTIVGPALCHNYRSDFSRRAMEDLAFNDQDDNYYGIDVKTHRISTKFNMPNLTSVERLARFYEDDKNYFVVLYIGYDVEGLRVVVSDVKFVPIEFLDWSCLTLGALGVGQIQIKKASNIKINQGQTRKQWMLRFCEKVGDFYPREISKIDRRILYFNKVRAAWEAKPD